MHDRPIWKLSVVAAFMIFIPAVFGQSPAAQPAPASNTSKLVLHTTTNMVLVDVVVTDKGKAVQGLDRTKFHLFEDGKEQTICAFDEHKPAAAPAVLPAPPALPPHIYSNAPVYAESGVFNVLLLDSLNTPLDDQMSARQQMIEYMDKIQPGTMLAVFTLSSRHGLRMVTGFTTDAAQLTKAVKDQKIEIPFLPLGSSTPDGLDPARRNPDGMGAVPASTGLQEMQANFDFQTLERRVHMTLDSMKQLGLYLSAIPGRKNVIWFSGSFPATLDPQGSMIGPFQDMVSYTDEIRKANDLLTAARVAVYPVDARGLMTLPSFSAANRSSESSEKFSKHLMSEQITMEKIAEETGGQAFINTNGLKEAVASAIENGSSYYTIAYTPPAKKLDGQFHKTQVSLDAPGYKLSYRRGYFADTLDKPTADALKSLTSFMESTMLGTPPATQVLLQARALPASDPQLAGEELPNDTGGEMMASLKGPAHRYIVDLQVDAHTLAFNKTQEGTQHGVFECAVVAYDANGKRLNYVDGVIPVDLKADQYASILAQGIPFRLAIDLPAGQQFLRIAVHDQNADHVGSLEIPLTVAGKSATIATRYEPFQFF
jgi:VWFA-related protein